MQDGHHICLVISMRDVFISSVDIHSMVSYAAKTPEHGLDLH